MCLVETKRTTTLTDGPLQCLSLRIDRCLWHDESKNASESVMSRQHSLVCVVACTLKIFPIQKCIDTLNEKHLTIFLLNAIKCINPLSAHWKHWQLAGCWAINLVFSFYEILTENLFWSQNIFLLSFFCCCCFATTIFICCNT